VKKSLEQVALLEGKITEARADALSDVSLDRFPPEFRVALSPLPGAGGFTLSSEISVG